MIAAQILAKKQSFQKQYFISRLWNEAFSKEIEESFIFHVKINDNTAETASY